MNKPSPRNGASRKQAVSPRQALSSKLARSPGRSLAALATFTALLAACAGSASPDDGARAPAYTSDAPTTTAAVTTSAEPTAQPTSEPTAQPTSAPTAQATAADVATAATTTSAPVSGPPGANLHVGSMTVDGLTVEDLACRAEGLGILGSMLVVGGLSKKKPALDACGKGKVHVEWTATKGSVSKVTAKAENNAKVEACVAKVLKGTAAPFEGECTATVTIGK